MLIDSHCHLHFRGLAEETALVIDRATAAGVKVIINIGVGDSIAETEAAVRLAQVYPNVFASVGVHPHEAALVKDGDLARLEALARDDKVVAIGEVGLDYYYEHSPAEVQKARLREFVCLARKIKLPLILHIRDARSERNRRAFAEAYEIVGAQGGFEGKGVLHCFTGDVEWARKFIARGFFISFTGIITFDKSEALREVVRAVPVEAILVETDAPFLAPEPYRGKTNEPAYVVKTAEKIAELKNLSAADVARITSRNTRDLFALPIRLPDDAAKIAYPIRDSLYLNITSRCTIACVFCPKFDDWMVKGHNLRLGREPSLDEVWQATRDAFEGRGAHYNEVVFCGFGEPTQRLDVLKEVARRLKAKGVNVRLDTDGLGNLTHGRNIVPELAGLVDSVSVSLNAADPATYAKLCPSKYGETAYLAVKDFIVECKKAIPNVQATVVGVPDLDALACRRIVEIELGVRFRLRDYDNVG